MIKKHLGLILIMIGCGIIAVAASLKIYTRYEQNKLINTYRQSIMELQEQDQSFENQEQDSVVSESNSLKKSYDISDESKNESNGKPEHTTKSKSNLNKANIIGILNIPKIDLCVAIGEGVDRQTLKYSVGHFSKTAMPGENGNLCLIGHRSYTYGQFFNRLNEMEKNDDIVIEYNGKKYKYIITEMKVVKPEEVSVLDQTKDKEITLITCTPIHVGSHRLIIKGVLAKQ